jgi:hypothetical protein
MGVWFVTVVVVYARGGWHDRPGLVLSILSALSIAVIIVVAAAPRWITGESQQLLDPPPDYPGSHLIDRWWPGVVIPVGLVAGVLFGLWSAYTLGPRPGLWSGLTVGASIVFDVWSWRWVHRRLALPLLKTIGPLWLVLIVVQAVDSPRIAYNLVLMPLVTAWIWIWVAYLAARLARALLRPLP